MLDLDHLVVACLDLDDGEKWVETRDAPGLAATFDTPAGRVTLG
jgi:hypothetical protein